MMRGSWRGALLGFWLGNTAAGACLMGWLLLGLYLYFMDSSALWFDVAVFLTALCVPLMAGGLTRKLRPAIPAGALWAAAALDTGLLGLVLLVNRSLEWENIFLSALLLDGQTLACWLPWLGKHMGVGPYDARMWMQEIGGLLLAPLVFTLGYLLARRPETEKENIDIIV